ncbi:hypothetical protein T4E_149 [Trichinella pseudospiralis]|uniref:Uncharacterized protein n=1 Tax=Trichinella pseudospiralis TaxID=6337 RepID=A0A0V1FIX1_TRIPS|nr:hypothetical protein T4E_149 [Trichinella pseudospiralis]KRY85916.1 hypothetical protein T4D_10569 [Trichinella pseudospiralis]
MKYNKKVMLRNLKVGLVGKRLHMGKENWHYQKAIFRAKQ